MKKKVLSIMLVAAMVSSVLAGCGNDSGQESQGSSQTGSESAPSSEAPSSAGSSEASSGNDGAAKEVTLKWAIWDESTTQYSE